MVRINLSQESVGGSSLMIEASDIDITFEFHPDAAVTASSRPLELTVPAYKRHVEELAEAFDRLADNHRLRKAGEDVKIENRFWVPALPEESSNWRPFRGVSVEHDNASMYIMASFEQHADPDLDRYERIQFPLSIRASEGIAEGLREIATKLER